MNNIEIYRKSNYGRTSYYVKGIKQAEAIQRIAQTKNLPDNVKLGLEELGFTFIEVIAP